MLEQHIETTFMVMSCTVQYSMAQYITVSAVLYGTVQHGAWAQLGISGKAGVGWSCQGNVRTILMISSEVDLRDLGR